MTTRLRNIETIVNDCSAVFRIPVDELFGRGRTKEVVQARNAAFYVARHQLGLSFPVIGRRFGRDHTTIIHGAEKIAADMLGNPVLAHKVEMLADLLNDVSSLPAASVEPFIKKPVPKRRNRREMTEEEAIDQADEDHLKMMRKGSRSLLVAIAGSVAA